MKIVFMGTADFSAIVLEKLNEVYPVSAVVTGLDKASGRGNVVKFSPIKECAIKLNIPVLQYQKVSKEGIENIKNLNPDIVVTAAFGQILSDEFLSIPKYGVLNVHASLLPLYRGASPIQWSIINGDKETGVTIMKTVKEVDAGDMLYQEKVEIGEDETAGELFDRLAYLGSDCIIKAIKIVEDGKANYIKQDSTKATFCKMITKEDGLISFDKTYKEIKCFINGFTPWPSAFLKYQDKLLKVYEVEKVSDNLHGKLGQVIEASSKKGLIVSCKDGEIRLKTIQMEGCKRMQDKDFLNGKSVEVGYVF